MLLAIFGLQDGLIRKKGFIIILLRRSEREGRKMERERKSLNSNLLDSESL